MRTKNSIFLIFSLFILALLLSGTATASPPSAVIGTGFTYQGRLTDGSAPADGSYDFQFSLYDANSGGSQVGSTVTINGVLVTDGMFMVQLDFGAVFNGSQRFLQIGVRPGGSGAAYTILSPRQALTAAPYAIYAASVPWSGLTGIPGGFADGIDNDTTYTAGEGLELAGTQFNGKGTSYQNVVIVAKSGGDFTSIQAALDSISDASAANPYLVYVAPGVYSERVTMKPYVDIEGAGEQTTRLTYTGSDSSNLDATLIGADDAEVRFLIVENTGGTKYATAIGNIGSSPRLVHVTANALGGSGINYGIYNYNGSSPTMTDVHASASGGADTYGVFNSTHASPTMTNVTASASGGQISNSGIYNHDSSSPIMTGVTSSASGGMYNYGVRNNASSPKMSNMIVSASDGSFSNSGIYNFGSSSPKMVNVTASASGGINSIGVYNITSSSTMSNMTVSASGGSSKTYGVENFESSVTMTNVNANASEGTNNVGVINTGNTGYYTVVVNHSQIGGSTYAISNGNGVETFIGASQLSGGLLINSGTITCIYVYNETYSEISCGPTSP